MISGMAKSLTFLTQRKGKITSIFLSSLLQTVESCSSDESFASVFRAAKISCNVLSKTAGKILCAIVMG